MDMRTSCVCELPKSSLIANNSLTFDCASIDTSSGTTPLIFPDAVSPNTSNFSDCDADGNWPGSKPFQVYCLFLLEVSDIVVLRDEISLDIRIGSDCIREIHFPLMRK